ncbi:unnamed protein product [Peronospora belbahrii]|uniref:Endonuclease/exonuclease/phosphatase domain-containing protein n=1 Tax=Peronospora belbahrii TaxID=622444 RepID=A0AAU9KRG1_9STRA|nr:unnamed protein product [Peronospora belbahrii]CAH0514745.1 unnamed protein product [Peronospora belbahrii]
MLKVVLFASIYLMARAFVRGNDVDDVQVQLMSFNVRTSLASTDAGSLCSNWNGIRKENVLNNIKTVAADFVGTQETSDAQKAFLDAQLAGMYAVIGESTGSLNGNAAEWNAMYYRSDTWTPLTNGMFWLGPDPNTMSAGWGMAYYRTCVWGRFQHIVTRATICVLNTHYETPGNDEAQTHGSNIILDRIKTNCDATDNLIVLMGDFNALKSYSAMQIMFNNDMEDPSDEGTFCGDMLSATCSVKYDFTLFRTQNQDACYLKSEISRISYDGCYTSDHAGLIGSFCFQGSCCSNRSSSSSGLYESFIEDDNSANQTDVIGKVQAPDTETSKAATKPPSTNSSPGAIQTISTSSSEGGGTLVAAASIMTFLALCILVALVVIHRKKKLDEQARLEKLYEPNTSEYFGTARAVSNVSALSPFPKGDQPRVSNSTIPELAVISGNTRISTSSSVTASDSEVARHDDYIPELPRPSSASDISSRRSSTAVMNPTNSEYSSAFSNSVLEKNESDGNESIISYGNSSVSSYGNFSVSSYGYTGSYDTSSILLSKVNFSEIFAPGSCVSDDSTIAKSQADFIKL